jgi:uncharacterized protein YcgI (DUF1989 family)
MQLDRSVELIREPPQGRTRPAALPVFDKRRAPDSRRSLRRAAYTEIGRNGRVTITRRDTKPGDHVDLMALVDVLAIPNVCGADVMRTSNFALKPVRLTLFEATEAERRPRRRRRP